MLDSLPWWNPAAATFTPAGISSAVTPPGWMILMSTIWKRDHRSYSHPKTQICQFRLTVRSLGPGLSHWSQMLRDTRRCSKRTTPSHTRVRFDTTSSVTPGLDSRCFRLYKYVPMPFSLIAAP
jgi:hypothetical protein